MSAKEQLVKKFFNAIADKYDLTNFIVSFGRCNYWRRYLLQKIGRLDGATILDVCCGTGKVTLDLAKKAGPQGVVVGVDFSENMLAIAKKNSEKLNLNSANTQIQLIQGNAMDLPFPEHTFNCATIAYGLRNVTDLRLALAEMKRVVKPGGIVASLEMSNPGGAVFGKLYDFYAGKCIPLIGKIITKNKEPYQYLYQSIIAYPNPDAVTATFRELGFKNAHCYKLTMGVAAIHVGEV
jgi:demethylmenaquinone methyltransferase/2-methoxy-6-polyprenyl-1,4-benzoquinol methylase